MILISFCRRKFGAIDEPLYVAYPKSGLGIKGIEAIINSVRDEPKKMRRAEKVNGGSLTKKTSSFHLPFHHHSHRVVSAPVKTNSVSPSPPAAASTPSIKIEETGSSSATSET